MIPGDNVASTLFERRSEAGPRRPSALRARHPPIPVDQEDYLEREEPAEGFLFGTLATADVSLATFFLNAAFARYRVDASRWTLTAAYVARVIATPSFTKLQPFEDVMMRTPPAKQREALAAIGAPLMATSYGSDTPRRGLMKI